MSAEMCPLCRGAGNLLTLRGRPQWWTCSACGGAGVTVVSAPPTIAISRAQGTFLRPIKEDKPDV